MLTDRTSKRLDGIRTCTLNGHKVKDVFSLLTSYPDLWLLAYSNIQGNRGAMTPGVTNSTVDGFSEERAEALRLALKTKTYKPKPVRRVEIPKANGKVRPLGIPDWDDRLVQEVARIILETIYEPVFKDTSHGFRKERSCHTALKGVQRTWTGIKWIIEIDIKGYFDNIDHEVLLSLLARKIEDKAFLKLITLWLKAGYMKGWMYHRTYSGTPQGGIISPILANVYLHELDQWMETRKSTFEKGDKRVVPTEYRSTRQRVHRARKRLKAALEMTNKDNATETLIERQRQRIKEEGEKQRRLPSVDPFDPNYRRLRYCRYADDFIIGIIGTKQEAKEIMEEVSQFMTQTLKLTVSEEKSRINHCTEETRFLGYNIFTKEAGKVRWTTRHGVKALQRTMSGGDIKLSVPKEKMASFCRKHGIGELDGPIHEVSARKYMMYMEDMEIMAQYNAELRGFAQYYALSQEAKHELHRLGWYWEVSLAKTLAGKHKSSVAKIYQKYRHKGRLSVPYQMKGKDKRLRLYKIADLERPKVRNLDILPNTAKYNGGRVGLVKRLQAQECEYCGDTESRLEVHHVRKMGNLTGKKGWEKCMIAMKRKTLVVCNSCHDKIHSGTLPSATMRYRDE